MQDDNGSSSFADRRLTRMSAFLFTLMMTTGTLPARACPDCSTELATSVHLGEAETDGVHRRGSTEFEIAHGGETYGAAPRAGADHHHGPSGWSAGRAGGHGPIGVMGEHTHGAGELMLSYRYMFMSMQGNRSGTDNLAASQVVDPAGLGYMVTPTKMDMQMHMIGAMYAVTDELTVTGMVPLVTLEMDHVTRAGGRFTTKSSGPGDLRLGVLYRLLERGWHRLHLNAAVSLPTGSIDKRDATPMSANAPLPYPMQLGSGTFDVLPGITYLGQTETVAWGTQVSGNVRVGENDNGYSLGNQLLATTWLGVDWRRWINTSVRLDFRSWGNIDGFDTKLGNPATTNFIVPTADPNRRGGKRLDVLVGVNLFGAAGSAAAGHRLAVEIGRPVYQDLDGPQLETDWIATIGWQYTVY